MKLRIQPKIIAQKFSILHSLESLLFLLADEELQKLSNRHRNNDKSTLRVSAGDLRVQFTLPGVDIYSDIQKEIQRREVAKAQAEAQAEAPKFSIGSCVRILFDAYWRSRIFAEMTTWEPADEPLRGHLEGEEGFVSEVFPGKVPGERPRYGVRTCLNGVWDGGYYIFGECELEAYTPPTLRSLRTVRAQDLAVGLRVRIVVDGPLRGKTATVVAVDGRPSGSVMAQVQLDEEFQEGVFWALYCLELEPLEGSGGQA